MTVAASDASRGARTIVEEFFTSPLTSLRAWVGPLSEQIAKTQQIGGLTTAKIDALVEPHALKMLASGAAPLFGAGFIAAIDLLSDARNHLAWWQGEDRRQLVLAAQSVNKENIDYSALEWFRVPMDTGEPFVAGPYVDYLCSDDYTVTFAVPAVIDGVRIGVAGADMMVAAIERVLIPRLNALEQTITVVNRLGRVVVSTDPLCATGASVRGGRLAELPRVACTGVALDVIVEEIPTSRS